PDRVAKSVGHERTFEYDLTDRAEIRRHALDLCDRVAARLSDAGQAGRTVVLKVRFGPGFRTITRSRTAPAPLYTAAGLFELAGALLDGVDVSPGIRLLGVSVSNLGARPHRQLTLGGQDPAESGGDGGSRDGPDGQERLAGAVDQVRRRFGEGAVRRARPPR
ncbi:MAG: DNA polymerase IV, partial [Acidimicrobiales bacterium]